MCCWVVHSAFFYVKTLGKTQRRFKKYRHFGFEVPMFFSDPNKYKYENKFVTLTDFRSILMNFDSWINVTLETVIMSPFASILPYKDEQSSIFRRPILIYKHDFLVQVPSGHKKCLQSYHIYHNHIF